MSDKKDTSKLLVVTPEFRAAFEAVFEKKAFKDNPPIYSLRMLFPKSTDLTALKRAANNALIEKWGADKSKWPKKLQSPFHDGNEKSELSGHENTIFINTKSKFKVQVVGNKRDPDTKRFTEITQADGTFYAGCYARAEVKAHAYDNMGNRGVSFWLTSVQKIRDGEPFQGGRRAEDVFDEVSDGSDDADNYETPHGDADEYEGAGF